MWELDGCECGFDWADKFDMWFESLQKSNIRICVTPLEMYVFYDLLIEPRRKKILQAQGAYPLITVFDKL